MSKFDFGPDLSAAEKISPAQRREIGKKYMVAQILENKIDQLKHAENMDAEQERELIELETAQKVHLQDVQNFCKQNNIDMIDVGGFADQVLAEAKTRKEIAKSIEELLPPELPGFTEAEIDAALAGIETGNADSKKHTA